MSDGPRVRLAAAALVIAVPALAGGGAATLLPLPARAVPGQGTLAVTGSFAADAGQCRDDRVALAAGRLPGRLARRTGLRALPDPAHPALTIRCGAAPTKVQQPVEDESYTLDVTGTGAQLQAPTPYGALRGVETFLQLVEQVPGGFGVGAVRIEDRPRFPWRGLHVDAARHFMPVDAIERTLDGMAVVKLNVLHWHLTDDQGFRFSSRRYPRLQGMGSDGEYYTQAEMRHVVAYARERGIRVVPELDVPGHTGSWLVGHPELAAAPGPYLIERRWGIFDPVLDPTRDEVYRFLDRLFGEVVAVFPDPCLHVGGDEVNGVQWDASPAIAEFKRRHDLASNEALQEHFNRRLRGILAKHGRSMVGWDEIFTPDLPADAIVQSWRGAESLAAAARAGHRAILSSGYYLDHLLPASTHYKVDPLGGAAAELSPAESARILGGEACMWNEYVSAETLDSRVWPRAAAVAERLWSPATVTDVGDLYRRLDATSVRLECEGLRHRSGPAAMQRRIAGGDDPALSELAAVLEPDGIGQRAPARFYTSLTPLNRLVDALPAESGEARRFAAAVDAWLADPKRRAGREEIARRLASWSTLADRLAPTITGAPLLGEIQAVVADLATAARVAQRALEDGPPVALDDQEEAMLSRLATDRAEVRVAVAPALARLIGWVAP